MEKFININDTIYPINHIHSIRSIDQPTSFRVTKPTEDRKWYQSKYKWVPVIKHQIICEVGTGNLLWREGHHCEGPVGPYYAEGTHEKDTKKVRIEYSSKELRDDAFKGFNVELIK